MKQRLAFSICLPVLICLGLVNNVKAQNKPADTTAILRIPAASEEIYIGFGKQPGRFITSAISTVKGTDLRQQFTTSIANTLAGRLPGFTVNVGGSDPGAASPATYIRGLNTYGFSSAPLVIIDGFLGDYTQLVPDEVEEISVLKDASATSVYGMRGANGVVLVTTKKGRKGPLSVSFTAQYGFQQPTQLPKFLDSYNYASLYNEALANDGRLPLYSQTDLDAYRTGSDPYFHPNVDWYKQTLRSAAPLSDYTLNFSGGDNTVRYFILLNALGSDGLYKNFGNDFAESNNPGYNRYNLRGNVDVTISKVFSAQLNIGGSIEDKKNPGDLTTGTNFTLLERLPPNAFPVTNPNGSFGGNTTYSGNPLANLTSTGFSTSNASVLQSSFKMTAALDMITPGLSATGAVGFNNYYEAASNKRKSYQRYSLSKGALGDTVYTSFGQKTSLTPQEIILNQSQNYTVQGFLNYNLRFGGNTLTGMLMFNSDYSNLARNYPSTDGANQSLPFKSNRGSTRITYVANDKYIAEFSASEMGTENFPEGSRYGFFPAGSIGWVASNESFLKDNKAITFLKLRGSYGMVGNEAIGGQRFMFAQRYAYGASYYFGTGNGTVNSLAEGRRLNEDVTWEREKKANIGIEVNLFNHLGLVVDVFKNNRYNILASANGTIPSFLGYNGLPDLNIGKVENKGFEATLRYTADPKKALQFFAEGIISYAKNTITYNGEPFQLNKNLYSTGSIIGQPFGLQAIGLFQSDAEIAASAKPLGISVKPGDVKYRDIGGPNGVPDGVIDNNDVTAIGNTDVPAWTGSFHTGFSYKGFDVDLFFQGVAGVSRYLNSYRYFAFQDNGQAGEIALTRWTPQTAATATYPRLSADNNLNNYRFSSFWQRDGSFIRLRNIEIGYTFQPKLIKRIGIGQTRVFVNGTNLLLWDKIKEADVEAINSYPMIRTVSAGVKLQL